MIKTAFSTCTFREVWAVFVGCRWQAKRSQVESFVHDGSWEFQDEPQGKAGWCFWTGNGKDASGKKTEHVSPDPRGGHRVLQGSTAGYFGVYSFPTLPTLLESGMPDSIPATYTCYQPSSSVTAQIELGGQGMRADGQNASIFTDRSKTVQRFEDVDGMEWIASADGDYFVIHEARLDE